MDTAVVLDRMDVEAVETAFGDVRALISRGQGELAHVAAASGELRTSG
jgi:hypothetical protein